MALKHQAKRHYEDGNFQAALETFQASLAAATPASSSVSATDRQILLSNIVACRLRLGGTEQAQAAVQDAQQCIRCNNQWAKGHLRLAEAYIAWGGHSNQACNSLQTALRLDPGLSSARQLLLRELRRDHRSASSSSSSSSAPTAPPSHASSAASDVPTPTTTRTANSSSSNIPQPQQHDLDDVESSSERAPWWSWEWLIQYPDQALQWYHNQSEWNRILVRFIGLFLFLYVAFGGRFGLEYVLSCSSSSSSDHAAPSQHGNYGPNNAYEQYRRQVSQASSSYYGSTPYLQQQQQQQQSHYGNDNYPSDTGGGFGWGSSSSWDVGNHSPTTMGGGGFDLMTFVLLVGAAVLCHQAGINPLHALVLLHRLGRRNQYHRHNYGAGGLGGGFGGMGWMGGGGMIGHRRPRGGFFR